MGPLTGDVSFLPDKKLSLSAQAGMTLGSHVLVFDTFKLLTGGAIPIGPASRVRSRHSRDPVRYETRQAAQGRCAGAWGKVAGASMPSS